MGYPSKEPKLGGKGGKDKSSYSSDVGGAQVKQSKADKLAKSCGKECSSKDAGAYSSAGANDMKKQAGA